ncbi:MAG: tyrosine-type recombinase/integrase [Paracoccaceae bacterium]|nr:tyrosine-type recombinase/integrase [Paracoccaceae bacterium]
MKTTVPYVRERSDSYWEIVFEDPATGKSKRRSTGTKDFFEAEGRFKEFLESDGEHEADDGPRLRPRKDGIWESRWTDDTGKPRRKSHGTRNQEEASAAHAAFVQQLTRPQIPNRPTIAWVVDRYYEDYICREKPETTSGPMAANVGPLKEYLGHYHWDDVTQDLVEEYIEWRMQKPRWSVHQSFEGQYGETSRNTACKDLRVLRAALRRSKKNKYTSADPDFEIVEGDPVRDTKTWITMKEMERMIAACRPQPIYVNGIKTDRERDRTHIEGFLLIALASGARKEAILELTWDQVYIPETRYEVLESVPVPPDERVKGGPKYREIRGANDPIDRETGRVLEGAYIDFGAGRGKKRRPQIPVSQNPRLMEYLLHTGDRTQPYVISYKGKPVKSLKKGLAEVAKEAGIPKSVTHHTMKRTAITHMVRAGIPLEIIADAVNTTVAVLKKHYNMHRPDVEAAFGDALSIR